MNTDLTKIYRIHSTIGDCCYIGITRNHYLSRRLAQHKYAFRKNNHYCSSFRVLKYPDAEIELITEVPTINALIDEAHYINQYNNSINIMKKRHLN